MKKTRRMRITALLLALAALWCGIPALSYDGAIHQGQSHAAEVSMYRYDLDIYLYNPCNAEDMDEDAVYLLWFDFDYTADNGYGKSATYRFDMSWKDDQDRNLNPETLRAAFIRPDDNACMTRFSVWVPGIVNDVRVFLNMDGGERLAFTVESITLNGFRVNVNTDYVSSAYYDSSAEIRCHVPRAAMMQTDGAVDRSQPVRDQFGGVFTDENIDKGLEAARYGDPRMLYHAYDGKTGQFYADRQ